MTNTEMAVTTELGSDGILVATMNLPGRPMNVVGDELMAGIAEAVARLADPAVKGLVLTSGKADFCAGGDLDRMSKWTKPEEPFEMSMAMKRVLRQLETQGKPAVAAINGHALGGGLEIALAFHARFAIDDPRLKIGQPEVKLGLLPGGGGTVRLPRLVGIQQALQICAEGNDIAPSKALAMGLITALAKDRDDLMAQALNKIPNRKGVRLAWYGNQDVISGLSRQMPNKENVLLSMSEIKDAAGMTTGHTVGGIPLRRVDQLLSTEARVT